MEDKEEIEALEDQLWEEFHKKVKPFQEHKEEREALRRAQDGDPSQLEKFIYRGRHFQLPETRDWVVARLRGDPKRRGMTRTLNKRREVISSLCGVAAIMHQEEVKAHKAIEIYCSRNPRENSDTIKTRVRRDKNLFEISYALFQISAHRTDRGLS